VLVGRYRIEQLIGAGSYGAVYRAVQLPLGREVAIKVVCTRYDDGVARFEREAAIAQRLEHPHTVRVYDHGTTPSGLPFLVLELLRGRSLERVIAEEGPRSADSALQITAQILKSLMEAHALGIIHRDIKPANVFITSHPGEPTFVKLLDFGLAKELTARSGSKPQAALTRVGEVMGTPSYMSPEQVTGSALSASCDLYAVGLVLVEMLSAKTLFDGPSVLAIAMAQASPKPAQLPPEVVGSLAEPVVRRAIEKRADKRYATAAEMLADVERALRPRMKTKSSSRRTMVLASAGLLVAALLGALGAVVLAGAGRRERPRKPAAALDDAADAEASAGRRPDDQRQVRGWRNRRARSFRRVDVEAVARREGFEVLHAHSSSTAPNIKTISITLRGSACAGTVMILEFDPQADLASAFESGKEGRVFVEHGRLLYVAMYSQVPASIAALEAAHAACTDAMALALSN